MGAIKKRITVLIIAICFCMVFVGCADGIGEESPPDKQAIFFTVSVTNDESKYQVVSSNPVTVQEGGSAQFTLKMVGDYYVDSVMRKGNNLNAGITNEGGGTTTIVLGNIAYSMIVSIECVTASAYAAYYPNGGEYIGGGDSTLPYTAGHALKSRLRPNTEIGTNKIARVGYTLIGWNTKADGSGEHIGLGSRATMEQSKTLKLYAEWSKETDIAEFTYTSSGDGITITKYKGTADRITIPAKVNGLPVDTIDTDAISGKVQSVVLPPTIISVEHGAFVDCSIKELYFYDNIAEIFDDSFVNCPNFSTLHINAIEPPRYGPGNLYSEINFTDKYDILMLNAHKKKAIVFGGSGAYISIDTLQMEQELDGYTCINMAVNGWFNAPAQFDMMLPFLGKDDIFIHVPESSSMFGFMYSTTMTPSYNDFLYNKLRFFGCLESNYDLISLMDIRNVTDLFTGFSAFNSKRSSLPAKSYTDYLTEVYLFGTKYTNDMGWIDERGNFALPRMPGGLSLDAGEADIVPEYITYKPAHNRLNAYYDKLQAAGVGVYFITAPVNSDTLYNRLRNPDDFNYDNGSLLFARPPDIPLNHTNLEDWTAEFESAVTKHLNCTVLAPLSETIYQTSEFFDADYHLADAVVPKYTQKIIDALGEIL